MGKNKNKLFSGMVRFATNMCKIVQNEDYGKQISCSVFHLSVKFIVYFLSIKLKILFYSKTGRAAACTGRAASKLLVGEA